MIHGGRIAQFRWAGRWSVLPNVNVLGVGNDNSWRALLSSWHQLQTKCFLYDTWLFVICIPSAGPQAYLPAARRAAPSPSWRGHHQVYPHCYPRLLRLAPARLSKVCTSTSVHRLTLCRTRHLCRKLLLAV